MKLVAIDLDRTLLRDDKSYDYHRFKKVYRSLSNKGVLFAIISGHSRQDAQEYIRPLDTEQMYFVTHNGNHVVYQKSCLRRVRMLVSEVTTILREAKKNNSNSLVIDDGYRIYYHNLVSNQLEKKRTIYPEAQPMELLLPYSEKKLLKIAISIENSSQGLKLIMKELENKLPNIDIVLRKNGWLEFHSRTDGKGEVLTRIQKKHHISPAETLTFGNHCNDISMNSYAKYAVAMGNSSVRYRLVSPYLIGSNEDQAVISLLEEMNQKNSLNFMENYKNEFFQKEHSSSK